MSISNYISRPESRAKEFYMGNGNGRMEIRKDR